MLSYRHSLYPLSMKNYEERCELKFYVKPEKIRDAQGRRPGEDGYDPTTLFVPADFLKDQTPGII